MFVVGFPFVFLFFIGFLTFFHGLSSISLVKNKKIQALVKIWVFLIQKLECIRKDIQATVHKQKATTTLDVLSKKHVKIDQGLDFLNF